MTALKSDQGVKENTQFKRLAKEKVKEKVKSKAKEKVKKEKVKSKAKAKEITIKELRRERKSIKFQRIDSRKDKIRDIKDKE